MQEARGASLNAASDLETTVRPPRIGLFAAVALTVWLLDQATKLLAVHYLDSGQRVYLIDDLLWLTLVRNPGAAFGLGTNFTIAITVVAIIVGVTTIYLARRVRHRGWAIALGFFFAGAVGNLTDRMLREPGPFRGHVIDFLAVPNFPVFNVADISLNVAAALIIWLAWTGVDLSGERESTSRKSVTDQGGDA